MTIVTTVRKPRHGPEVAPGARAGLLEVVCLHPRDVRAATEGGADRVLLMTEPELGGRSPDPAAVSAACRETDLPVRVVLRPGDGWTARGAELGRLRGLAEDCLALGAGGFSHGFLDADLEIDLETTGELVSALPGVPWGFHRGFDAALSADHAWHDVRRLPGLDAVASGGATRGLAVGGDELVARASADPAVARLVLAGGGLEPGLVPWLVRAGVGQLGLGQEVRPGASWQRSYVDAGHVRAWRMLLDDAVHLALGIPVG